MNFFLTKGDKKVDTYRDKDNEKVKTADAFIFRFIKLDKLEKLEVVENGDEWLYFRKIRNILTREYPDNAEQISQGISSAL
ncbi:MAG: hypothetical protein ACOX2F_07650 [bacterium]